jgi:cytochrome c-type biogenesis protein CcmH
MTAVAPQRRLRALGWLVLALVAAAGIVVAVVRDEGPANSRERIEAIARTLKCPTCEAESVYDSRATSAQQIKAEIARQVSAGRTDAEIRAGIERSFPGSQFVPPADGLGSLVWVMPVVAAVAALGGLVVFFRSRRLAGGASAEDRALVAAALAAQRDRELEEQEA